MKNKKTQLVKNTVDSIKNISKKGVNSLILSAVAAGAVTTEANAVNVGSGNTISTTTAASYIFNVNTTDLTVSSATDETVLIANVSDNAITGDVLITTHASDTGHATFNFIEIDLDAGTTPGKINFTDVNLAGSMNATWNMAGKLETDGTMNIITLDQSADAMVANFDGVVTVAGAVIADALAENVTGTINLIFSNAAVTMGSLDLDGTNATATFDAALAADVDATIDGTADAGGNIVIANAANAVSFESVLGATNHLATITGNANSTTIFDLGVDVVAMINNGTMSFADGDLQANTIANNSTMTIQTNDGQQSITAENGTSLSAYTAGDGSNVIFNTGTTHTGNVKANFLGAADSKGTITVVNSNDAAAGVLTFTGVIGGATTSLAALNVGSATKAGALIQTNAKAYDIDAITITGGNIATEISTLTATENITSANGISLNAAALGDAVLAVTDDTTFAATITGDTGAAAGTTEILISGSSKTATFNQAITGIDLLSVDTGKGMFAADVTVTATTGALKLANSAGLAEFSAATDLTLTGNVTAVNGEGTLNSDVAVNKTFTVTGTTGATDARLLEVLVDDDSNTLFKGAVFTETFDIDSDQAANGTTEFIEVTTGNEIGTDNGTSGALQIADGAEIRLDNTVIGGTSVFDAREVTGSAVGVLIDGNFNIRPSATFTSGTVNFIDGANANLLDSAGDATDGVELANMIVIDNVLTDYTMVHGAITGADADIVATAKSAAATGIELGIDVNQANSLRQGFAAVSSDATLKTLFDNKIGAVNGSALADATDLAKQIAPQTDTVQGSTSATRAMTGTVQGIVSNRMASLRSGDAYVTGMSAGDGMSANSGFIQAFQSQVEQDNVKKGSATVFGYDAETSGVAIGFDGMSDSGSTIGLSASFSSTDVDGLGTGKSVNSIDSYTVSVYADKSTDAGYLEGSLTYGINDNESSRLVNVSGLSSTFSAAYDSTQLSLKVSGGMPTEVNDGTYLTPFASVASTLIDTDTYIEKSTTASDPLRLKVAQDSVTSLVGTLGIKAHKVTDKGTPMISLAVNNEFGDTTINANNTYQGGGTAFKTSTQIEELSATLGLGYSFGNDLTSLNIGYEAEANDDEYLSHYGSVKIVSKF
jgi:uncharacterized protein with beta-barrel porin domain